MNRPYKYSILDKKTNRWTETNIEPLLFQLQTYEPTENPNVSVLTQTKICFIDTRYEAKKRLFEYLHQERKRKCIYEGTEIGKSIPILF